MSSSSVSKKKKKKQNNNINNDDDNSLPKIIQPKKVDIPTGNSIIKINCGGQIFVTTIQTLNLANDSYFSALIKNQYANLVDENGAIFVDRNPEYFKLFLDFFRTGELELQEKHDIELVLEEARFYSLQSIVDYIEMVKTKKEELVEMVVRHDGFYFYKSPKDPSLDIAITFRKKSRLFFCIGEHAYENLSAFLLVRNTPKIWDENQRKISSDFSDFVHDRVLTGIYKIENFYLMVRVKLRNLDPFDFPGICTSQTEILLPPITCLNDNNKNKENNVGWEDFVRYKFVSLSGTLDSKGYIRSLSDYVEEISFDD